MSQITYPSSSTSSSQVHTSSTTFRSDSSKNSAGRFALLLARTASPGDSNDTPAATQRDPEAKESDPPERTARRSVLPEQPPTSQSRGNEERKEEESNDTETATASESVPSEITPQATSDEALATDTPATDAPVPLLPVELSEVSEDEFVNGPSPVGKSISDGEDEEGVAKAAAIDGEFELADENRPSLMTDAVLLEDQNPPSGSAGSGLVIDGDGPSSQVVESSVPTETANSKEGSGVDARQAAPAPSTSPQGIAPPPESVAASVSDSVFSDSALLDAVKEVGAGPAGETVDSRDATGKPDTNVLQRADTSMQFAADRVLPPSAIAESTGSGATGRDVTEAAARPESGQPLRIVDRVRRAFLAAQRRGAPLRIRLHPPELGSLKLELHVQRGVVKARMETDTAAAQSILSGHVSALKDRLAESGLKVDTFEVAWRQPGQGGEPFQEGESFRRENRAPRFAGRSGRALEAESTEGKSARPVVDLRAGRLNVQV